MLIVISYFVGALAITADIIIYLQKKRSRLLVFKLIADVTWTVYYLLCSMPSAAAVALIAVPRELIFMNREKKQWAKSIFWPILFCTLDLASGILTWQSVYSIFPAVGSMISVISFWIGNPRLSRLLAFPISGGMITYDIVCNGIMGILNESFVMGSSLFGILFIDLKKKKPAPAAVEAEPAPVPAEETKE